MKGTFASIFDSISEYCELENGKGRLIQYVKTEKANAINDRVSKEREYRQKAFGGVIIE